MAQITLAVQTVERVSVSGEGKQTAWLTSV